MSEIKCRVCGATPDKSESIYGYPTGEGALSIQTYYQHRHAYQCVDFLTSTITQQADLIRRLKEDAEFWFARESLHSDKTVRDFPKIVGMTQKHTALMSELEKMEG
jgi:hypothetical protein